MVIRRRDDRRRDDIWDRNFFGDWDDFFDLDREFRRMEEWMNRIMREFGQNPGEDEIRGPYVYGFTMRVGPDGKPRIEEFGNVPKKFSTSELSEYREPLVDVMENDKNITVTAELPGVTKEDIELSLHNNNQTLVIKVDTAERKYYKEVALPDRVNDSKVKATYNNGILDIIFEREKPKETKHRINIE